MHVLFICHEYPPSAAGGIGTAVATLARGLVKVGHRVTVIGYYPDTADEAVDQGVTVIRLKWIKPGRLIAWYVRRSELRRQIVAVHCRARIDVIEWPDWDGWYLRNVAGIADVLKLHGGRISHRIHGFGYRSPLYEHLELRMMRRLKNWIGVSEWFNHEWKAYSRASPFREVIVYNPVDTTLFKPVQDRDTERVFYSGGLRKRKGVLALARAARVFLSDNPNSKLVLATFENDVSREEFRREVGPLGSQVQFLAFMEQKALAAYMAQSTVFAMPSFYESCGNGWIEAMACGVPVVGSIASCGPEIVSDGVTGVLGDPNDPRHIAEKVSLILRNPCLAEKLGKAGRLRALAKFSLDVAVKNSEEFYSRCLLTARLPRSRSRLPEGIGIAHLL